MIENVALSKDEITKFLKLLRVLIDVKCGTGKAIRTVATEDEDLGEIMFRIYDCLKARDLVSYSNLIYDLSGYVKPTFGNESIFSRQTTGILSSKKVSRYFSNQMFLFFTSKKFHNMFSDANL
jgi:hypothetical protein